jgi:hypothetical protein
MLPIFTIMICKKKKFKTRTDALSILYTARRQNEKGRKKRKEQRVYFCNNCSAYHLTSDGRGKTVNSKQASKMYLQEVLYGNEIREYLRLKNFDLDKEIEKAKAELHKRIDWRFFVEFSKLEEKWDKTFKNV